jgi:dTDP-4-amino-4,6-dideoxygalactose transaminase
VTPKISDSTQSAWHLYVIRSPNRDKLKDYLAQHKISTVIHYPIPPHLQNYYQAFNKHHLPIAEKLAKEVLSLPLFYSMKEEEIKRVATTILDIES